MRHAGFLADFVATMKATGKPAKVILMAVARRLLTIANATLRTGFPFRAQAPSTPPSISNRRRFATGQIGPDRERGHRANRESRRGLR